MARFFLLVSLAALAGCRQGARYERTEAMIPMRDGVALHTLIYRPAGAAENLPLLLNRSPYGQTAARVERLLDGAYRELALERFIFVFQDIRGRYQSEGKFVMLRPVRDPADPRSIDEGTDTSDTIGWLLKNVPGHNGRAGILGISYGGWLTVMTLLDPHPALKAASEQASPADMFLGDDFHHNGAFRLSYGFEYVAMMETGKENFRFPFDLRDTFEWYLRLGPLSEADRLYFHGERPTWNDFVRHPNYDSFWQRQAVAPYLRAPKVPNLNVAGWWDQEDFYGPFHIYGAYEKHDAEKRNFLVVGPWNHGGWSGDGRSLGAIEFGSDTAQFFRHSVQARWFAYWLKDKGVLPVSEALVFQTGRNQWESFESWPPRQGVRQRSLYFGPGGTLGFDPPREDAAEDRFVSDPAHPVPYRHRPIEAGGPGWGRWLVEDQRFVHLRPDVLSYSTAPLPEDFAISGNILARLFASTTGSDCDWIVKLIDVYPEEDPRLGGYQLMIASEVTRARFRESFQQPKPLDPGKVYEFPIGLHTANHVFRRGHRIMVQVQSTWFPLIDRNPQTFVGNIFRASAADYQPATHHVFRARGKASQVSVMVRVK
jgi:putative CocE/NonD family hydrolase